MKSLFNICSIFNKLLSLLRDLADLNELEFLLCNLTISNLSVSDFKLAKPRFLWNSDVSTLVVFFKSAFVACLDKSNSANVYPALSIEIGQCNY